MIHYISFTPGERQGAVDAVIGNHMSTRTHAGALVLRWSFVHGWGRTHGHAGVTMAEIAACILSDVQDWSGMNRVDMDLAANDPSVPISMFFLDANGAGFITRCGIYRAEPVAAFDSTCPGPAASTTGTFASSRSSSAASRTTFATLCVDNIQAVHEALPGAVSGSTFLWRRSTGELRSTWNGDSTGVQHVRRRRATIGGTSVRINPMLDLSVHDGAGAGLRLSFRGLSPNMYAGMPESLFGATSHTARLSTSATSTAPREVSMARSASSLLGMRGWRPSTT